MKRLLVVACATVALLSGCTCTSPGEVMHAPADGAPGRKLDPLPVAPNVTVAPDALAGAGQSLTVVAARPQGEQQGEVRPTVTFSRPVKSLEMVEAQRAADAAKPFAKVEPAVEGEWRWLGSASAEFVPKGLVPFSTEFTVTVFKGLKGLDGSELAEDYVFRFTTPRLEINDLSPAHGSRWLTPDSKFAVLFNQPVTKEDLLAHAKLTIEGESQPLALTVEKAISIQDEHRAELAEKRGNKPAFEPMSDEDRGFQNRQWRYTLAPTRALPLNKGLKLTIDAGLHGAQGPLTMRSEQVWEWSVYGPFELTGARMCVDGTGCSYGPLVVTTSNEADLASFKGKVRVTPPVEIDWDAASTFVPTASWEMSRPPMLVLPGKWKPGTQYKIEIAGGGADVFKQADTKGLSTTVQTEDLSPSLVMGEYLGLVEAGEGPPRLPVEVANLHSLQVQMWKLSIPELVKALARQPYDSSPFLTRAADWAGDEPLKYPKNMARVHPLDLTRALGAGAKTGVTYLTVTSKDLVDPGPPSRQLVQVTDLAAHIKVGPKSSLAWVTRLSNGQPVPDADVSVYDETGASLWSGKTSAEGFADIPGTVALKLKNPKYQWENPFALIVAQKDGDLSATANTWASGVEPYEFGLSQGWEGEAPQSSSFVFTDRGIYRPGDTVFVKGVVRYRVVGELKAPEAGSTVKVTVSDSRGNEVSKQTVKLTKFGTWALEAVVPKESPTGYSSVSMEGVVPTGTVNAQGNFRVEEYRAPQFRVDVDTRSKDLLSGDALEVTVAARYLFGGAMSNVPVKWSAHRASTSFSTDTAPDFTFSQETWWWDDNEPQATNGFFGSGEAQADAKGEVQVKAGRTEAPGGKPYSYTLEAEVTDVNRQSVAGRVEVTVHPAAYYVGLRSTASFLQVGTEYPLDTLVVDPRGAHVAGRPVEVVITSRTWKSVKKKSASGGFETISEPEEKEVAKCQLSSETTSVPCKFKPATAGFFIVRATVKDEQNRQHQSSLGVYATGSDWVAWQRNDTDRVELLTDKTKYDVGDVAKVLIKSPYPEAKALLTVEREGVTTRRLVALKGSVVTVEVPITEEMVPTMYVGVIIMRPRVAQGGVETGDDPGRPNARIGLVKLNVERKTRRLQVAVKADQKDYRPRDTVQVDVAVKDSSGAPANGEVTLYVVDEAVLRLTAYQTPDPIESIFPERPLSMRLGEPLLHLVRKRSYGEKGESAGGGGGASGEGAGFRSQFKTTVLFSPTVELKGGVAKASFTLPDNLTTFRVMAVVVGEGDRYGSGDTTLQVNKPVMALPALPRLARVGDVFEAGVVVHRHGSATGEVTVTAQVEGGAQLTVPAEQKVALAEGAPKEVRFGFKATAPGTAKFRFQVKGDGASDGVEEKIPVILPVELDAVATSGDTSDSRVEGLVPPAGVYDDQGGLQVTLSSTAMSGFGTGFQQLISYPYGCLEQQSSRLVPFIALREIAGQFGTPWPGPNQKKLDGESEFNALLRTYLFGTLDVSQQKDPDEVIRSTVKSILALQNDDGSFRYWPSAWCSDSWASTYATLALARAKEVGFDVPADRLKKAQGFVATVAGGTCNPCEYSCDDEKRVFAAYTLARMGKPKASTYEELYGRRDKLSLFSRALLANAMFVGGGNKPEARTLLQEILNFAKESPQGLRFEEVHSKTYATYYQSDTRTAGVVLQALTDIQPDHPFVGKLAHGLMAVRQGNGEWRSTQEAAFSLMALTEVLRTKEKDTPDFTAKVSLGANALAEQPFKGRSLAVRSKLVPMKELLAKAGGDQKLTFSREGTGVLYYTATLKYATKELPTRPLDSGLFVQRWFEPYAGGGQSLSFTAGELVRVRVRVASNQERNWVAIDVPLPAGLEPVDTSLATTARLGRSPDEESRDVDTQAEGQEDGESGSADGEYNPWAFSFWSPFNYTEMRDDRVVLFADTLPPGVHVTSFVARATTPGTWVLKPAKGTLMYEPEVWGRSEGGQLTVTLPPSVTQK